MSEDKTISVGDKTSERHFNTGNLTYFIRKESGINRLGYILIVTPTILSIGLEITLSLYLNSASPGIGILSFGGLLISIYIYLKLTLRLSSDTGAKIGTVSDEHKIIPDKLGVLLDDTGLKEISQEFSDKTTNCLSLSDHYSSTFLRHSYNYQFVMDNISSIEEYNPSLDLLGAL